MGAGDCDYEDDEEEEEERRKEGIIIIKEEQDISFPHRGEEKRTKTVRSLIVF